MALSEYAVPNDFFYAEQPQQLMAMAFPCCVCRNKDREANEEPCRFCGHNECAEEFHYCRLCGEIQPGEPGDDAYLAYRTPAQIGPICGTCRNTILAQAQDKGE